VRDGRTGDLERLAVQRVDLLAADQHLRLARRRRNRHEP